MERWTKERSVRVELDGLSVQAEWWMKECSVRVEVDGGIFSSSKEVDEGTRNVEFGWRWMEELGTLSSCRGG